jgi:hypothetical protein
MAAGLAALVAPDVLRGCLELLADRLPLLVGELD